MDDTRTFVGSDQVMSTYMILRDSSHSSDRPTLITSLLHDQ